MEEKEKLETSEEQEEEGSTKRDFLKMLGAGFGIAGIGSLVGAPAMAQTEKTGKYVIVITHGGDDPNRAILGLLLAQTVGDKGWGKVHVWVTLSGADLANKKRVEKIQSPIYKSSGTAAEIMKKIRDKGGWFGCCPPCAEYFGSTGSDKIDYVELAGGDWLMKNIQDAWVVWM